jgi:serine/threonine protein kinase
MDENQEPSELFITTCPSCSGQINATGIEVSSVLECPHCQHNFRLTRQFGNYLLEKQIGAGGMGAVYLGTDLNLKRQVAIKVLKAEISNDYKFTQTFLREAEITASLNHPNIVQVYAFGQEQGQYYIVMEHISGGSLDDRLAEKNGVTELEGIEVGIAVASGLQFALERGLIHRDIKPGNILFGANNAPKVVDFGLALTPESLDHFAGEIWGTPYYVPPEKLDRQPEDFRSDLYSLATTLFHAIAGRPPFDAEDPSQVAAMHLKGTQTSIRTFKPSVSQQTSQVIARAMARYPDQRYQSYEEFIAQLEDAKRRLLERGGQREESSNLEVIASEETSNKQLVYGVAIITGLVLLLAVFAFLFRDQLFGERKSTLDDYDPNAAVMVPTPTPKGYRPRPTPTPTPH